jgi:hypothetical protein
VALVLVEYVLLVSAVPLVQITMDALVDLNAPDVPTSHAQKGCLVEITVMLILIVIKLQPVTYVPLVFARHLKMYAWHEIKDGIWLLIS